MFRRARIKLTAWYLAIIMAISISFSVVIFVGINRELSRFSVLIHLRQDRANQINLFLRNNGLPTPPEIQTADLESVEEARSRIISILGLINLSILILAGSGGYFLAGRTLEPIRKNMEDQKEFVSNASHELRTPLTALTSEIEVALRDRKMTAKESRGLLKSNLEEVKKMSKLSNYLLKLNRYETGRELPKTDVDLKEVVLRAISKQKVKTELTKAVVNGNEDALIELVSILLDNAFKYGNGKEIVIRTKKEGFLEIEDHGIGISKDEIPHIFDRFYRSDKSRGADGYGLGLSIAKSIVDLHGGTINVESKLGKGTKFTVKI